MDKFGRLTRLSEWKEGGQYRMVHSAYRRTIKVHPEIYVCIDVRAPVNSPGGNNQPGYIELKVGGANSQRWSLMSVYKRFVLHKGNGSGWEGEVHWLSGSYATFNAIGCSITLEGRPHYCDRGSYLAKLHVTDPRRVHIDNQDLWPRFYFDLERAKAECEAWLEKRGLLQEVTKPKGSE